MLGGAFQIAKLRGIPIRVHMTLLILLPYIGVKLAQAVGSDSLLWGLLAAVGLFASVALHELGHAFVAGAKGYPVRDILLLPIGGMAQLARMPERPRDEFQVASAGPLVSFALYAALTALASGSVTARLPPLALLLELLGDLNLGLFLFNLLPAFPMDGGRILRAWLTPRKGRLAATHVAARAGKVMALLFGLLGLFHGNFILVLIAFFIYFAAGAEYRAVLMQEMSRQPPPFWPWPWNQPPAPPPDEDDVVVSPPPFRHERAKRIRLKPLNDLFNKWR
jgi:Zn-dependent protease